MWGWQGCWLTPYLAIGYDMQQAQDTTYKHTTSIGYLGPIRTVEFIRVSSDERQSPQVVYSDMNGMALYVTQKYSNPFIDSRIRELHLITYCQLTFYLGHTVIIAELPHYQNITAATQTQREETTHQGKQKLTPLAKQNKQNSVVEFSNEFLFNILC